MGKAVKVSDETYEKLNRIAGELRSETGEPVSISDTVDSLVEKSGKASPLDYAGSWKLSDEEHKEIMEEIGALWETWQIGS